MSNLEALGLIELDATTLASIDGGSTLGSVCATAAYVAGYLIGAAGRVIVDAAHAVANLF